MNSIDPKKYDDQEVSRLKQELEVTKEHLQSLLDKKDTVNKELYQANKVLQSNNIQLSASKEFAENLVDTANAIVLTLDTEANITTFNKYAEALTGYKKEEILGKNWFGIFILLKDKETISDVFGSAIKNMPEASQHENHIVLKSGMERLINWSNNVLRDASGNINGVLSVGIDITEQRLAEEAYKETYEINKMILSESPIGIALYDHFGQCMSVNKSMAEIIGATKTEVLAQNYNQIKSWKKSGLLNMARTAIRQGGTQRKEVSVVTSYDKKISLDCYFVPFLVKGKSNLMVMVTDNSASKQAELEKIKAQQYAAGQEKQALVGQVAGKMAHDFNNILGIIMGNAELSLLDCNQPEIQKILKLILDQTIQGKNLTKNLVAFAKDQEIKQEFFKINKKIDLVLDLLKRDLNHIEVVKDYTEELPNLLADSGMIEHSLVNLIQNSIHALGTVDHPRISIRTYCIDDSWVDENYLDENICFEIEDNGCGIPKEHLENIFLPSFTLKGSKDITGSYNKEIRGTGYGMSNIKKYVEQHKGTILVDSELGSGTKFIICLPIIRKELTNQEKEEIFESKSFFEKNILLVEDETAIADIQNRILTHAPCNHKVDIANDGHTALELIKENTYDFISLDYVLPGSTSGMDVYHKIRETNKNIPILFISGNIEFLESIKDLKQKDTNIDHLSKPCSNKEYLSSVNELMEKSMDDPS